MAHLDPHVSKVILVLVAALATLVTPGCRENDKGSDAGSGAAASASASPPTLPPLVLRDDTPGALITWVDEQGNFHVTEKVADVPEAARDEVRVVVAGNPAGTGETVYVADVRTKGADGTYPVRAKARQDWDERGASKRKARLEALAPSVAPPPPPLASGSATESGAVSATIYGASWCGPCHQAEALLKSIGVKVTMKDIEKVNGAEEEMRAKLAKAGRKGGSIPIIDVMGTILVGYSEGALRAAVQGARGRTQTL